MKVKIYTESLDYLSTNLLVLPFFHGIKPLKGTIGFIDWRLNSFLSKLIIREKIEGRFFEKILIPPMERIPAERILLTSLGEFSSIDPIKIIDFSYRVMETVHKISFSNFSMAIPVETEKLKNAKEIIEAIFKGVDKFAVKVGICEFLDNLRITFVLDRTRQPLAFEHLSNYLSARSSATQSLINA